MGGAVTGRLVISLGLALSVLAGCTERDVILPGERLDIRDGLVTEAATEVSRAQPISLPGQQANASYTHRGGSATHYITHPALGATLTPVFSADIGEGNSRRFRITADPVVANGRVFTMDAKANVTAVSTSGGTLWTTDVTPASDRDGDASGGGLAVAGDTLYVTSGFGRVTALDVATGAVRWVQDLNAPAGSAPTVSGDFVYVVSRNSRAWAINANDGRIRWSVEAADATANFAGGAGAAVADGVALFPFPSGEVMATYAAGGTQRWSTVIGGNRLGAVVSVAANDIGADPVIVGSTAYVGNVSGRVVALNLQSGDRRWTATEGATSPVLPVGGSVFLVNDINELVRLSNSDGSVIWRVPLPQVEEGEFWERDRRHVHFGPILAGGRLIVASSDGYLRAFSPVSGELIAATALPGGAASHPVVAGQTLYVVSADGQLRAFR